MGNFKWLQRSCTVLKNIVRVLMKIAKWDIDEETDECHNPEPNPGSWPMNGFLSLFIYIPVLTVSSTTSNSWTVINHNYVVVLSRVVSEVTVQ